MSLILFLNYSEIIGSSLENYTSNNTRQHEHNTRQHDTTRVKHDTIRVQHDTKRVKHNIKSILIYLYHRCILGAGYIRL